MLFPRLCQSVNELLFRSLRSCFEAKAIAKVRRLSQTCKCFEKIFSKTMQKPTFLDLNQLNMQQIVCLDTKKTEDIHIQAQQATTAKKGTIQPNANKKNKEKDFSP